MNKDYQKILVNHFDDVETKKISAEYLKKYWLDEYEWTYKWKQIKDIIFSPISIFLPDMMFNSTYRLIAMMGGAIFVKKDFQALQKCMLKTGDKFFVMIENANVRPLKEKMDFPHLRFKFPSNITWEEFHNGDESVYDISYEAFMITNKEYFIFGDSKNWGRYTACEYWDCGVNSFGTPLDIIGFKPKYSNIFSKYFRQSKEEVDIVQKWLPLKYKNILSSNNVI
jgi:hypothetical protein